MESESNGGDLADKPAMVGWVMGTVCRTRVSAKLQSVPGSPARSYPEGWVTGWFQKSFSVRVS